MDGPALAATGLSKRFKAKLALDSLELSVSRGTVLALIGPNGAGKTTLIRTWLAFERADSGHVEINGIDPRKHRDEAIDQVAYVPQRPSIYAHLTVAEHLSFARALRPTFDSDFARRRLEDLGIPTGQRAGTLSGGQAAQLNLAIALGSRARILLLDEPLASLDPLARRELLQVLLSAARAEGLTVLISTHNVTEIESSCDQVAVLQDGRLALDSRIDDIRATHQVARQGFVPPAAHVIGAFPDGEGSGMISLWKVGTQDERDGWSGSPREATAEEVGLGYLVASRNACGREPR